MFSEKWQKWKMIKHERDDGNDDNVMRVELVSSWKQRWDRDGLSNLKYEIESYRNEILYTNISVDLYYPAG